MNEHELQPSLGMTMQHFRTALELGQETFADSIGMQRAYYSALERGKKNPTIATLHRVVIGLRITMSQLFSVAESRD